MDERATVDRVRRRFNPRQILLDFASVAGVVLIALLVVRQLSGIPQSIIVAFGLAATVAVLHVAFHVTLHGYRSSWRFFSTHDALACFTSAALACVVAIIAFFNTIPVTGWVLVCVAAFAGVLAPRLTARIVETHDILGFSSWKSKAARSNGGPSSGRQTLLMVGYGDHVASFIRSQQLSSSEYEIAGLVHIDNHCEADSLRGVPVLGSIDQLKAVVERLEKKGRRPDFLVLTRDEMSRRSVAELLSLTDRVGIRVAWLPRSNRIDENSGQHLRPIKLDDLLPRSTAQFDARACSDLMDGATVLVTGAGGSIGSELARQIADLSPKHLILTDVSEHALYLIDQDISRSFKTVSTSSRLLDVRDRRAVERAMERNRPDFVFHAAALKHVPIVEAQACEGVVTNVLGSRNVADAAAANGVRAMVQVSTDKAVNPANVMGATKRLAEAYCQAMDAASPEIKGNTRYVTVRFGNVLGSNGSVVPLFQKQLEHGGPLTVTHPDVERFFMTIPEASRLILEALLLGVSDAEGEQGIFVLDMGEPVKIADFARQVIRLSGLKPETDVKIVYTGLRPGEKLYEELMHETEDLLPTQHPSLMVARPRFVQIQTLRSQIEVLTAAAEAGDVDEVLRLLKLYIPEFDVTSREARSVRETSYPEARPEAV